MTVRLKYSGSGERPNPTQSHTAHAPERLEQDVGWVHEEALEPRRVDQLGGPDEDLNAGGVLYAEMGRQSVSQSVLGKCTQRGSTYQTPILPRLPDLFLRCNDPKIKQHLPPRRNC